MNLQIRPPGRTETSDAPLSHAQQRLWFIDAARPGAATYNVPFLLRWVEPVDATALTAALRAVVDRHPVLRTVYPQVDGQPVQRVLPAGPVEVTVVDLDGADDAEALLDIQAAAAAREPFDLATRPPVRCTVWHGPPHGDAVLLTFHHIAVDGWSMAIVLGDLDAAYTAALAGRAVSLPEPAVRYTDYAIRDRADDDTDTARRRLAARAAELRPYAGDLVLGRGRRGTAVGSGGQVVFGIADPVRAAVHDLARRLRVTPFVVLFAAYQAVLYRWTGRDAFLVATVTANRPHTTLEDLVGFFVNLVPLRCDLQPIRPFADLCGAVRTESYRALSHQVIPFDRLSAELGSGPVAPVGFTVQNMPAYTSARWQPPAQLPTGTAKFDLFLILEERSDGIVGTLEYDEDAYPPEVAARFAGHYQVLLPAAVADPDLPLHRLPITTREPGTPPPCVLTGPTRDLVSAHAARTGASE